jgi:hypothetical protein
LYLAPEKNMATPNNVTKDWNQVKATASAGLKNAEIENDKLLDQYFALTSEQGTLSGRIDRLENAIADKSRTRAERDEFTALLAIDKQKITSLQSQRDAVKKQTEQARAVINGYIAQVREANAQLATQANATTPATNATIAATVTPASAKPGNPNVATTPAPAPNTTAKPASAAATTTPAPAVAKTTAKPATTTDPSKPAANANAATTTTTSKPPPIAVVSDPARDIVINTAPITVPTIDIKTGKTTGNTTINLAPITIPGEKLAPPPAETGNTAPAAGPAAAGLTAGITTAAGGASAQDLANFTARADWRVRLALAPESKYLYNNQNNAGILAPLQKTDGVIFPYTPAINVSYAAQYDPTKLTHSNYTMFQYTSSSVDSVSITCDFTAQDVFEANYMLAVIHFFRSMTKMFYGQDSDPKNGTPPPLCYLYGLGGFQFDALPLAINGFNYVLPQDVDYIKTTGPTVSVNAPATSPSSNSITNVIASFQRLGKALKPGGKAAAPNYENTPVQNSDTTTWVPTKINLSISCVPIMSRNAVSNRFSLTEYANGTLLRGTRDGAQGGGFW